MLIRSRRVGSANPQPISVRPGNCRGTAGLAPRMLQTVWSPPLLSTGLVFATDSWSTGQSGRSCACLSWCSSSEGANQAGPSHGPASRRKIHRPRRMQKCIENEAELQRAEGHRRSGIAGPHRRSGIAGQALQVRHRGSCIADPPQRAGRSRRRLCQAGRRCYVRH